MLPTKRVSRKHNLRELNHQLTTLNFLLDYKHRSVTERFTMLVYIASPYSNVEDKENLMKTVAYYSGKYMKEHPGEYAITGLVHHYACQEHADLGTDWNFWKNFCVEFLRKFDKLVVLKIEGWDKSRGVAAEIELASILNIPIEFIVIN